MRSLVVIFLMLFAAPAVAQEAASRGTGATLRVLDKVSGQVTDIQFLTGEIARKGRISIRLRECRYPKGNPSGDAFAFLDVAEDGNETPVFRGWMIASSPALNAMDHSRYDVWVLRCKTS